MIGILGQTLSLSATDIAIQVISTAITALAAAVITGRVMIGRLDERMRAQESRLQEMKGTIDAQAKAVEQARLEQARAELRIAQNYATTADFCQVVIDNGNNFAGLRASIQMMAEGLHSRVTALHGAVAELRGRLEVKQ